MIHVMPVYVNLMWVTDGEKPVLRIGETMTTPLERIHQALDIKGVPERGRVKLVCEKTGYSQGMVSKLLSGKSVLLDRFINVLCSSLLINKDWVVSGAEPTLTQCSTIIGQLDCYVPGDVATQEAIAMLSAMSEADTRKAIEVLKGVAPEPVNVTFLEAVAILSSMSEPNRWRAVAALKEMGIPKE